MSFFSKELLQRIIIKHGIQIKMECMVTALEEKAVQASLLEDEAGASLNDALSLLKEDEILDVIQSDNGATFSLLHLIFLIKNEEIFEKTLRYFQEKLTAIAPEAQRGFFKNIGFSLSGLMPSWLLAFRKRSASPRVMKGLDQIIQNAAQILAPISSTTFQPSAPLLSAIESGATSAEAELAALIEELDAFDILNEETQPPPHSLDNIIKTYKIRERLDQLIGDEKSSDVYPELTFEFLRARFEQLTFDDVCYLTMDKISWCHLIALVASEQQAFELIEIINSKNPNPDFTHHFDAYDLVRILMRRAFISPFEIFAKWGRSGWEKSNIRKKLENGETILHLAGRVLCEDDCLRFLQAVDRHWQVSDVVYQKSITQYGVSEAVEKMPLELFFEKPKPRVLQYLKNYYTDRNNSIRFIERAEGAAFRGTIEKNYRGKFPSFLVEIYFRKIAIDIASAKDPQIIAWQQRLFCQSLVSQSRRDIFTLNELNDIQGAMSSLLTENYYSEIKEFFACGNLRQLFSRFDTSEAAKNAVVAILEKALYWRVATVENLIQTGLQSTSPAAIQAVFQIFSIQDILNILSNHNFNLDDNVFNYLIIQCDKYKDDKKIFKDLLQVCFLNILRGDDENTFKRRVEENISFLKNNNPDGLLTLSREIILELFSIHSNVETEIMKKYEQKIKRAISLEHCNQIKKDRAAEIHQKRGEINDEHDRKCRRIQGIMHLLISNNINISAHIFECMAPLAVTKMLAFLEKELSPENMRAFLLSDGLAGGNVLALLRRLITNARGNSGRNTMQEFSAAVMGFIQRAINTYGDTLKDSPLYADFINRAAAEKDYDLMILLQNKGFPYRSARVMDSKDDDASDEKKDSENSLVEMTPYQQLLSLPKYMNSCPQQMFDNSANLEDMKHHVSHLIAIEEKCFPGSTLHEVYISRLFFEVSKSMYKKIREKEVDYFCGEDCEPIKQSDVRCSDQETFWNEMEKAMPQIKKDVQAIFSPESTTILPGTFCTIDFTACIKGLVNWVGSNDDSAVPEDFFEDDVDFPIPPKEADRGMKYVFGAAAYEVMRDLVEKGYPRENFFLKDNQERTVFHLLLDECKFKQFTLSQAYLVMHFAAAFSCFFPEKLSPAYLDNKVKQMEAWFGTKKILTGLQREYVNYREDYYNHYCDTWEKIHEARKVATDHLSSLPPVSRLPKNAAFFTTTRSATDTPPTSAGVENTTGRNQPQ